MTNKGLSIKYGGVPIGAKENFSPKSTQSKFDTLSQLQKYNLNFINYANPCELYQTVLDGTATAFPSVPENANLGLWSEQVSNNDGTFTMPVVLELESDGGYSSQGLTLTFDKNNNIFATKLSIKWSRVSGGQNITLAEKEFLPDDAVYFCQNLVENYNKIVITFYALNMPKNRLKLSVVDYGYGTVFQSNELRGLKIIQQIDPLSTQIAINTADFTLSSQGDIDYVFQEKQQLSVYFNGQLKATTFIKKAIRKSQKVWNIQSEDYIGLMNDVSYYGGIYNNVNAKEVLTDIFTVAKVPFSIDESFENKTITGYIPYTTCRNALMQVCFAIQAVVDTSGSEVVKVFAIENEVKQTIPLSRIMQGQDFEDEETITGIEISVHSYEETTNTLVVYDSKKSGTGQKIFIKFSEPLHDLEIIGDGSFAIDEDGNELKHTNYAVINANADCILRGQKYEHTTRTQRKNKENMLANEKEKIVSVMNATLVSRDNVDNIIEKCYNYFSKNRIIKSKIVEGKHVKIGRTYRYGDAKYGTIKYGSKSRTQVTYDEPTSVGDKINIETEYLGILEGVILKQTFNLNGGIIIKDSILR